MLYDTIIQRIVKRKKRQDIAGSVACPHPQSLDEKDFSEIAVL
jgi:hypothetical protein